MHGTVMEVKHAVVSTFDGEAIEVEGGVYLSPEAYLSSMTELERLRDKHADTSNAVPLLVAGAALFGFAAGYWLAHKSDD